MATTLDTWRLDVFSDTICPWCWIGKRRLAVALAEVQAAGVTFGICWRPFQLNPTMPPEGLDRQRYRELKFGSWKRSQALDAEVAAVGLSDGLIFRHDLITRTPNTSASHVLIRLAYDEGGTRLQDRIVEDLFSAYFGQGRDIGDLDVLAGIAATAGMDREYALAAMADTALRASVARDENRARTLGIRGVPSVVLDGRLLFSGAQRADLIARTLLALAADRPASALAEIG